MFSLKLWINIRMLNITAAQKPPTISIIPSIAMTLILFWKKVIVH